MWKCGRGLVPPREGKDQRREGKRGRQRQHHRRQAVEHQHDGEGRRPVAEQIDRDPTLAAVGDPKRRDRHATSSTTTADDRRRGLQPALPIVEEKQQRAGDQRDQDRRNNEVLGRRGHRSGSLPSTWSVPVRPREASSTTRKSAVVAKLMTIAVRTSA